jgi:deoxyguanosine kinase
MKKMPFIVVEGFDGSGKSTIAKELSKVLGYTYEKTPSNLFQSAREVFDSKSAPLVERIAFYTADCMKLSVKLKTGELQNVVVDRFYYSTIAYHSILVPELIQQFNPFFGQLQKPDVVILVKPDYNLVFQRITARGLSANDTLFLSEENYNKIYEMYEKCIDVPIIRIVNNSSVQSSIQSILKQLNYE